MTHYREGDWITYRHHEGWTAEGKILEVRPDDRVVVGQHDNDPDTLTIDPDDITGTL